MAEGARNLNYEDRKMIEKMYKSGENFQDIADALGICHSTVYREVARGGKNVYSAVYGQAHANLQKQIGKQHRRRQKENTKKKIKEYIRQHPGCRKTEISKHIDVSYGSVYNYYDEVIRELEMEE